MDVNPDFVIVVHERGDNDTHGEPSRGKPGARSGGIWNDARSLSLSYVKGHLVSISLIPWNLAFPYRGRVNLLANRWMFRAKLRMLESLGMGLESLYAPDPSPWTEDSSGPTWPPAMQGSPKRDFMDGHENAGWFDAARYSADGPNFQSLVDLFRLAHGRGARTFLVLVPESSEFRARLPRDGDYHLRHTLPQVLGPAAPTLLDSVKPRPTTVFTIQVI